MFVAIGWRKDGEWKFGRVVELKRALHLCKVATGRTGVRHWPVPLCCRFDWETVAEWPSDKELLDSMKWTLYMEFKNDVVPIVVRKIRNALNFIDKDEIMSTVEFACYTWTRRIKPGKMSRDQAVDFLIQNTYKETYEQFKRINKDAKRDLYFGSSIPATYPMQGNPLQDLCEKLEDTMKESALKEATLLMKPHERQVMSMSMKGKTEKYIGNQLGFTQQRVHKLKSDAISKVIVEYKRRQK
jgi:hypothetical protein